MQSFIEDLHASICYYKLNFICFIYNLTIAFVNIQFRLLNALFNVQHYYIYNKYYPYVDIRSEQHNIGLSKDMFSGCWLIKSLILVLLLLEKSPEVKVTVKILNENDCI